MLTKLIEIITGRKQTPASPTIDEKRITDTPILVENIDYRSVQKILSKLNDETRIEGNYLGGFTQLNFKDVKPQELSPFIQKNFDVSVYGVRGVDEYYTNARHIVTVEKTKETHNVELEQGTIDAIIGATKYLGKPFKKLSLTYCTEIPCISENPDERALLQEHPTTLYKDKGE